MSEETSYDRVLYPGYPFSETHPDHLAVLGSLHGLSPAPAAHCRVLELGCGDGGNLIPMAYQAPGSTFLGIDLSQRAIASGQETIADLALNNIVLQCRDIMDFSGKDGLFDYIIAHGVYSWVPPPVRDKILGILAENLAPQGIAYLSYNTLPGAHLRDLVRSIMLFHTRAVTDDRERNMQSRGLLKALAEASASDQVYGVVLRDQYERVKDTPDQVLIHDDLDEGSKAFFLYQVVEEAAKRGLQYLADALPAAVNQRGLSEPARQMLSQIPEREFVVREQYGDFIRGRAFRKSLLCRHGIPLQRNLSPDCVTAYYLTSDARPVAGEIDVSLPEVVEFATGTGETLRTDHRLAKAAFVVLGKDWPRQFGFSELKMEAMSLLSQKPGEAPTPDETDSLTEVLFQAFQAGIVEFHHARCGLTTSISDKPTASRLARRQAGKGPLITNLLHAPVMFDDDIVRSFLPLVDGTRDVDELVVALTHACAADAGKKSDQPAGAPEAITREMVDRKLRQLARLGLLIA